MGNISSIRAKVKFEQRKSERDTDTREEIRMNERNTKKEGNKNEERKSTKIMESDGPISLRVHETYPKNIASLRGISYCTGPSSDF